MNQFPVKQLLSWYGQNKRDLPWRRTSDPYAIWVSEVMLQQTQVNTVIPYYHRFLKHFPTVMLLADASEQQVLKVWEGLGYYSRARNLHRAAGRVKSEFQGKIPRTLKEFRSLPGVGTYICAAVLSIISGLAIPVVDGNVLRVYTRYRAIFAEIDRSKTRNIVYRELEEIIPEINPGDFNQAIMELGALVCVPKNPDCLICPLSTGCLALRNGCVDQLPCRSARAPIHQYRVSIAVIVQDGKIFIQKRPSTGHLGGLWEFPGGKQKGNESTLQTLERECLEELGVRLKVLKKLKVVKHAYTHFKIIMTIFVCKITDDRGPSPSAEQFRWITVNELEDYPFPKANHKFFLELREIFSSFR